MRDRLHHLDGLRGLASLAVVIHHTVIAFDYALYSGLPEDSRFALDVPASGLPLTSAAYGDFSVCVFFVLSAYVLAGSFRSTRLGAVALIAKRYVRLDLPIFAVVLMSWIMLGTGAADNAKVAGLTQSIWLAKQGIHPASLWTALGDGAYGALLLGRSRYDSSLWTMPVEFQGSLVLILVFGTCRWIFRPGSCRDHWCGIACLLVALVMHGSLLFLFGVGAAASLFDLRSRTEPLCRRLGVTAGLVAAGLLLGTVPFSAARPHVLDWLVRAAPLQFSVPWLRMEPESFWHAIGAILLLIAINANSSLRAWFARPGLQFLGRISFPLYLVHVPLLLTVTCRAYGGLLDAGTPVLLATVLAALAGCASALLVGWLLTLTVERFAMAASAYLASRVQAWMGARMQRPLRIEAAS